MCHPLSPRETEVTIPRDAAHRASAARHHPFYAHSGILRRVLAVSRVSQALRAEDAFIALPLRRIRKPARLAL